MWKTQFADKEIKKLMKQKNVMISYELFMDLLKYFFADESFREEEIKGKLKEKLDKMAEHDRYTLELKKKKDSSSV